MSQDQTTARRMALPGLALAVAAAGMMLPPRARDMPPEPKRKNANRQKQAAQRKARAITRRAGK